MQLHSGGGTSDKVTIIIPIYNTEKYLDQCLNSVINQTYENLEIILIDDGSKDNSAEIAKHYEQIDKRVWLFQQENAGVSAARNAAMELATGEYVLMVDSDDWIEPEMVRTLVENIQTTGADISCCQYDKMVRSDIGILEKWEQHQALKAFIGHQKINGSLVNKLIKRDMLEGLHFDSSIKYGEDALFFWKVLLRASSLCITNRVLYHVVMHNDSASGGGFKPIRMQSHIVWQRISQDAQQMNPEYYKLAKAQLGKMAFDSWLMMMISHYENKEYERECRKLVRGNLKDMLIASFIKNIVKACACAFAYFPGFTRQIMMKRYI